MKDLNMNSYRINTRGVRGFTLIELLVVIAIIGILAALLIPAGVKIQQNSKKQRARVELEKVKAAIQAYKEKMGHFPPDNTNNVALNPLYYELSGCSRTNIGGNDTFVTLDNSARISAADLFANFAQAGIVNCSTGVGDEGGGSANRFLTEVKPNQYGETAAGNGVRVIGVRMEGPPPAFPSQSETILPFRYQATNPTNNVNGFDLWIDIKVGSKTNRICNWSETPITL